MNRPDHDLERHGNHPVVRRTVRRLRISAIAVVGGVAAFILVAGVATILAFKEGVAAGADAAVGSGVAARQLDTARAAFKDATARVDKEPAPGEAGRRAARDAVKDRLAAQSRIERLETSLRNATARRDAAIDAAATRPGTVVFGVLAAGFTGIGFLLFLVVRSPYSSARRNALELVHAHETLHGSTLEAFAALNATVEAKDRYTAGHGLRVTLISLLIGQELGLDDVELDVLRHAATFHDIGKIAVPDSVLQKEGRLTDREFDAMKQHPVESARICAKLAALRECVPAVRNHHERVDGTGYPDGLSGEDIPLGARIIAVADTWDAITSDRPYRRGQPAVVALDEIRRCTGTQFDSRVSRAFEEVLARDPWMFGLTPSDVLANPAAPGRRPEQPSRASEELAAQVRHLGLVQADDGGEIDWSDGFDADDLAA